MKQCNRCTLDNIRREAKREKQAVTVRSDPFGVWPGGQRVYVHPKDVRNPQDYGDQYFATWFAEVPDTCCC